MRWPQSLYWRIAIGLVAFLAMMLVVQAMLFTWVIASSGRTLPGQSPNRFARTVALDLSGAIERDPQLDLERYIHEQYAQAPHPFTVLLADGRAVAIGGAIPEPMLRGARARLRRRLERSDTAESAEPNAGPGLRFARPASIVARGEIVGVVIVPPRAPFSFLLRRFAPTLGLVAAGVLLVGAAGAALLIFGPPRRRLRALEDAARRIGAGDLAARAPDRGGDEIASVARAFNTMAAEIAARADALAESDRVRRQLLADVSHELTTPVTAMRGYLETLSMPELTLDAPTRARYLQIISDETSRLERIIGDLLDLARWEGGGGTLTPQPVATADLFARVVARHEQTAAAEGVRFTQSIAPGAETVIGDRDRLEQAVQNLASNAVRYAPPGTAIELGAARDAQGVVLTVVDHGAGVAADHLPHIFDRFFKADAARSGATGGSGLGLSIVKAIVERHGGRVAVSSTPGRTEFQIHLPLR